MKKKVLSVLLSISMVATMLMGCGSAASEQKTEEATEKAAEATSAEESSEEAATEETASGDLGDPVKLTVTLTAVSTDTHAQAMQKFKEKVEELSDGNITVEVYTDAQLFSQEEELAAVVGGDADMTLTSASWLTTGSPWISMFTAGYMFRSYDHMTNVLNGEIGQSVYQKVSDEQGILPLGAWYLGSREISLTEDKAIKTPEDLSGINLRMPNSDAWLFLGKALGANPTPISFSELYLSLQTGVVDGQDNPLPTVESAKFYEVQKSITITNHLVDSVWPAINSEKWNSLTPAQQDIILQGISYGREYCDSTNLKKESELIDFFKEKGVAIYDADIEAFSKHVLDAYLNDEISSTWDMDLYEKISALAK
ncbi:MAG: sialic acid TRAP transporter substrate-binding protein SiaP [Lachnospiraceae bacterium]|nr:sialic acid TRAP transporter substrate-binding protein SiaP [Lachnospiraceae bacterium]